LNSGTAAMPSNRNVAVEFTAEEPTMTLDMARPVLGIVLVCGGQVAARAALQKQQEPVRTTAA
jgi:hypothetical protein